MKKRILLAALALAGLTGSVNAQCAGAFYDGFESGSYTPTWSVGAGLTSATVTTTNPAAGLYRVEGTGGQSTHLTGLSTSFTAAQPASIGWWICPQTGGASHNYFVAGNASVSATNCIVFCYYQSAGVIRFVSSVSYDYTTVSLNTWYHIELRNINWTAHTFDIYVNNALQYTSFPFRSATQNDVSRVHLYNFNNATGVWDDIHIGNQPPLSAASFTSPLCNGGTDGSVDQTITSGTAPFTYAWSNGATTEDLVGVSAGTYTVTVTDNIGCTVTNTVVVTEPSAMSSFNSQANVSCNAGSDGTAGVSISGGTPGYTYSWSSGGTGASETGLVAGTYTCTITDANGCTTTEPFTITEPAVLVPVLSAGSPGVCPGGSTSIMASVSGGTGSYTYSWMPGNMTNSTETVSPSAAETYTLTATDANGCTATETITVTVYTPPTVILNDTTVCGGVFLDAGNPGSTYLWSDSSTNQTLGVTATGVYSVVVTDINGCSATDSAMVTVDDPSNGGIITITGGPDICPGDSTLLISTGDIGNIDWWVMLPAAPFWQQFGSGNPFNPGPPSISDTGFYQFMAIAVNGVCPADTSNIIVAMVQPPPVVLLSDTAACSGVTLSAGNPGCTYLWSTGSNQQTITVNSTDSVSVIVTDQFGCVGTDTAIVTINASPTVTGTPSSSTVCQDDANVTLTGSPSGGTWSGPGVTGNAFDPSVGTGPQVVTYSYTDTNGCSGTFPVTILVNACVGIAEQPEFTPVIYPNPNDGTFFVSMGVDVALLQITITDLEGRVVYSSQNKNVSAQNNIQVDMTNEATGVYFLQVTADGNQSTGKIVVTR